MVWYLSTKPKGIVKVLQFYNFWNHKNKKESFYTYNVPLLFLNLKFKLRNVKLIIHATIVLIVINQEEIMKTSNILILSLLLSIIISCSSSQKLKNEALKPYPTSLEMNFHYKLYHQSPELSELYVQAIGDQYRVTIRAYDNFRSKTVIYESTHEVNSTNNSIEKIKIPIVQKQYALELLLYSSSDKKAYSDAIWVDKTIINEQTLHVFDKNNIAFLKKYITINDGLKFNSSNTDSPIYIKYFDDNYKPAPPPQVSKTLIFSPLKGAKNTLQIPQNEIFTFVKEGLYFVHTDPTSENGIFIKVVDKSC